MGVDGVGVKETTSLLPPLVAVVCYEFRSSRPSQGECDTRRLTLVVSIVPGWEYRDSGRRRVYVGAIKFKQVHENTIPSLEVTDGPLP